mmetsp:Transcript_10818/g.27841  ORF Transcript_10818/g.27841 Transcript_10818/m.27841 type:complete len:287 (-) Transcript_10818:184-1044(-)
MPRRVGVKNKLGNPMPPRVKVHVKAEAAVVEENALAVPGPSDPRRVAGPEGAARRAKLGDNLLGRVTKAQLTATLKDEASRRAGPHPHRRGGAGGWPSLHLDSSDNSAAAQRRHAAVRKLPAVVLQVDVAALSVLTQNLGGHRKAKDDSGILEKVRLGGPIVLLTAARPEHVMHPLALRVHPGLNHHTAFEGDGQTLAGPEVNPAEQLACWLKAQAQPKVGQLDENVRGRRRRFVEHHLDPRKRLVLVPERRKRRGHRHAEAERPKRTGGVEFERDCPLYSRPRPG